MKKKYTKKELINIIDEVLLLEKQPNEADWVEELLIKETSKEDLIRSYISTLTNYFYHLRESELEEDYELSQKILSVIGVEEKNFLANVKSYCNWYEGKQTENEIKSIKTELNQIYTTDFE